MPKHIRQGIKGTLFSVSAREDVFRTFQQRAALWIMVKVEGERAFLVSWTPACDSQLLGKGLSGQGRAHIQNPNKTTHSHWMRRIRHGRINKNLVPFVWEVHVCHSVVCGDQRTASQSQSLPSSVWGQALNSGCQAWQQVPSPTKPSLRPINTKF